MRVLPELVLILFSELSVFFKVISVILVVNSGFVCVSVSVVNSGVFISMCVINSGVVFCC